MSRSVRWALATAVALASVSASCAAPPIPAAPAAPSGLVPRSHASLDDGLASRGHGRELVIDGDLVLVADANGHPILRARDGELTLIHGIQAERTGQCSSIALHASSRTLACVTADARAALVDVRDPTAPLARPWTELPERYPIRPDESSDVAIDGDTLWLASQERGLARATVSAEGTPGPLEPTGIGEDLVRVEVVGERVVALDRGEGLLVLDAATLARRGTLALDGPPLDLATDGERIALALGSEGARVVELDADGAPRVTASVQPRCVATGADLEGDALAVACLSGVTLYDLAGGAPRVAGFAPARFGMLDVAFAPAGLVVLDWYRVDLFEVDLAGSAVAVDVPRAMRLAPGLAARIPVRNPGDAPLEIDWSLGSEGGGPEVRRGTLRLDPGAEAVLELDAASLEEAQSRENRAEVSFSAPGAGDPRSEAGLWARTHVWHRTAAEAPADGFVGIGDRFPTLAHEPGPTTAPASLPVAGAEALVVFLTVDCYLQWPQLEDMAWSADHDGGQPTPAILFLTQMDEDPFDPSRFMRHFDAERLTTVQWADYQASVPAVADEPSPVRAFESSFMMRLPGADFPHDYRIDEEGMVTATSRTFRGRWPLGE